MPKPIKLRINPCADLSNKMKEISAKKNMQFLEINTNILDFADFASPKLQGEGLELKATMSDLLQKLMVGKDKTILLNNFEKASPIVQQKLAYLFDEIDPSCKVYLAG